MTDLRLHFFPDDAAILTTPSQPVLRVDDAFIDIARRMEDLSVRAQGFAVAAPQVGIHRRFFVFHHYYAKKFGFPSEIIINPEIISSSGVLRMEESCLSIPGLKGWMDRPESVTVRFTAVAAPTTSMPYEVECHGIAARVVQHEIDHLDGKLFHDQLDSTYRDKVARYFAKKEKRS